jgi:hypothetical protein
MRTPARSPKGQRGRRAAAVSTGTLLLCLWGSGTAFATESPSPLPGTGTLPAVVAPPVPSPVDGLVKKLSDATGITDPLAPAPHVAGGSHTGRHHRARLTHPPTTSTGTIQRAPRTGHRATVAAPAATSVLGLSAMPGLRSFGQSTQALPAAVAPVVVAPQPISHVAHSSTLGGLLSPANDTELGRMLVLVLAMMVVGGLAASHVKLAQNVLAAS